MKIRTVNPVVTKIRTGNIRSVASFSPSGTIEVITYIKITKNYYSSYF